jgi:pSer/pThr/pTyr-binding forkhead associated (FHA) protein
MDLGSYNGTYVNGVKLSADQPYPLESSDEIRLGRLIVRVYYK